MKKDHDRSSHRKIKALLVKWPILAIRRSYCRHSSLQQWSNSFWLVDRETDSEVVPKQGSKWQPRSTSKVRSLQLQLAHGQIPHFSFRRKYGHFPCCPCSLLTAFLSVLAALLIATVIAAILVALLTQPRTTTTSKTSSSSTETMLTTANTTTMTSTATTASTVTTVTTTTTETTVTTQTTIITQTGTTTTQSTVTTVTTTTTTTIGKRWCL